MSYRRYQEAVAYTESFIRGPADAPRSREELEASWQARLPSMARLLARMGDPHLRYPTVHVGGTSGKGSTSAIMAAILRAAGYKTGLHTSPYLQTAVEKVCVNGSPMPPQDFVALVDWARPWLESTGGEHLNYVQVWTALTLAYFAQQQVDAAVVEVSLGGRFDYTNVITPAVAAITSVDFDHTAVLGTTLAEIAWHKAGIVKPSVPVVTGVQRPEALDVIVAECQALGAPLHRLGQELDYTLKRLDLCGAVFDWRGFDRCYPDLELRLLGEHQVHNACLAVGMAEVLRGQGWPINEDAIRQGLQQASIPGRLEVVQEQPLVILDGAHNPEKGRTLRRALEQLFPGRPLTLVLGIGAAKEAPEIIRTLAPGARLVVCTAASVTGKPAILPEELLEQARSLGVPATAQADPHAALDLALAAAADDAVVCVTGSLFLVGQLRERWHPTQSILDAAAQQGAPPAGG